MKSRRLICLFLSAVFMLSTVFVNAQNQDVFDIISDAVASSEAYIASEITSLEDNGGLTYGFEWYVISMLRAGKNVDQGIMDNYLNSLADAVSGWNENTKPSDIERTALALSVMGEDITEFNGVDIAKHIYNSSRLADTSTELSYALLALDAKDTQIPEDALWQREDITEALLGFALENGGFSLNKGGRGDIDVTAICISALAPYAADENIKSAIDRAVDFLGDTISEEFNYADNPNTTAQVLMALSVLGIDVTNSEFGNSEQNIITALEKYRNPEGNGYVYQGSGNAMATLQIMQAYDAYRKMMMEGVSYWDFLQTGENYDDKTHNNPDDSQDKEEAQPATVYVTIASGGVIADGKDGVLMAQMPVTVTDIDEDGTLTVDEALFCAHESYYDGGAESGYLSYNSTYGLSLAKLWGKGSIEEPTAAGYWLNNASCMSLADPVEDGDFLSAFNYCDTLYWSDAYSYFTNNTVSVTKGDNAVLELRFLSGYDADNGYAPVFSPCTDAVIKKLGTDEVYTTDENGCVMIDTSDMDEGEYRFVSFKDDGTLVPSVCVLTVKEDNPGDSGSHGGTDTIRVHLRVADPAGKTYLAKKSYSVEKKTTVYELLCKTNLDIETSKSPYGVYIVSIEGLSEFDDGSESGWVFTVNGKRPDISVDSYRLSNGDYVEVLYTRELGNDVGGGKISGASSSGVSYTVKFDTDGGSSVDSQKIKKNEYLIVPKEPVKEGYTFLGWYIDTKLSKEYSFDNKVTKNMILYAKWQKNEQIKLPFDDVRKEDAFYNGVCFVYEKGIMQGTDNGFAPEGYITREMFVTVLWRLDGCPNVKGEDAFEDVTDGSWYSLAVNWAKDKGITLGVGNKLFGVSRKITKEEMIVMMYRYCALKGVADTQNATDYIHSAITWAQENKIVSETNTSATATRAETAVILKNLYEVISK